MNLIRGIDMDLVLSWKTGDPEFRDDGVYSVMQTIARCYDVEIRYPNGIPGIKFTGNLSRKSSIQQILNQLEHQHIHCTIDGKIITVQH